MKHLSSLILITSVSLLLTGCGYTQQELFDDQYNTIAAPIFENRTFYKGMEFQLTEAVTKELELRTPYKVVKSHDAQTRITGTINSISQRLLSRTIDGGISEEVQILVNMSFEWRDVKTGKVIRKRGQIIGTGEFLPTRGLNETFEVAKHEALDQLAQNIVSSMRKDW